MGGLWVLLICVSQTLGSSQRPEDAHVQNFLEVLDPNDDSCRQLNFCHGNGKCVDNVCVCDKGFGKIDYWGPEDCSTFIQDRCPDSCLGHGKCVVDLAGGFLCVCESGYSGDRCQNLNRCQTLDFCSGHGTCSHSENHAVDHCSCFPNYFGEKCDVSYPFCPNSCSGHGICHIDEQDARACVCDSGFHGFDCSKASSQCLNGCGGLGRCNGGVCDCPSFAVGRSCNLIKQTCPQGCSHGYCKNDACKCVGAFEGELCNIYSPRLDLNCLELNMCSGHGICVKEGETAYCSCFDHFGGKDCSVVESAQGCPNFCSGHGTCKLSPQIHCECQNSWFGSDCATSACRMDSFGRVCSGNGLCEKTSGIFSCTCKKGFKNGPSRMCELELCPLSCGGNGNCTENGCVCNEGYRGSSCTQHQDSTQDATPGRDEGHENSGGEGGTGSSTNNNHDSTHNHQPARNQTTMIPLVLATPPCINNCSENGQCIAGVCSCGIGYSGVDCSLSEVSPRDGDFDLENLV